MCVSVQSHPTGRRRAAERQVAQAARNGDHFRLLFELGGLALVDAAHATEPPRHPERPDKPRQQAHRNDGGFRVLLRETQSRFAVFQRFPDETRRTPGAPSDAPRAGGRMARGAPIATTRRALLPGPPPESAAAPRALPHAPDAPSPRPNAVVPVAGACAPPAPSPGRL